MRAQIEVSAINQKFEAEKQLAQNRYQEIADILNNRNSDNELTQHALRNFHSTYHMPVSKAIFNKDAYEQNKEVYIETITDFPNQKPMDSLLQAHKRNFKGLYLYKVNFSGLDLSDANFQGAFLENANFISCILYKTNFQGTNLLNAKFQGSELRHTELQGGYLRGCNFYGANLSFAKLQGCDLHYAKFGGAYLNTVNLIGANLSYAILTGSYLKNAIFLCKSINKAQFNSSSTEIDKIRTTIDGKFLFKHFIKNQLKFTCFKTTNLETLFSKGWNDNTIANAGKMIDYLNQVIENLRIIDKGIRKIETREYQYPIKRIQKAVEILHKHKEKPLKTGITNEELQKMGAKTGRLTPEEAQKIYDEYNEAIYGKDKPKKDLFTDEELKKIKESTENKT